MLDLDHVAHDLAMAYLLNRYGADVKGEFSVSTYHGDTTGSGEISTVRLPAVNALRKVRIPTGEKRLFGLIEKKELVESAEREVDETFNRMIEDYYEAFARFRDLLARRADDEVPASLR